MTAMYLVLLAVALGVAQAENLVYDFQQPEGLSCPDQTTKCQLETGERGCCIAGTEAAEKLPAIDEQTPDQTTQSSEPTTRGPFEKIRCDNTQSCDNKQTCCRIPGGKWGCCPYKYATCCRGSKFCCPKGKRCSNPPGRCF